MIWYDMKLPLPKDKTLLSIDLDLELSPLSRLSCRADVICFVVGLVEMLRNRVCIAHTSPSLRQEKRVVDGTKASYVATHLVGTGGAHAPWGRWRFVMCAGRY